MIAVTGAHSGTGATEGSRSTGRLWLGRATVTGRGVSARSDAAPAVNVIAAAARGGGVTG